MYKRQLYDSLKSAILAQAGPIGVVSAGLAEVDLAAALAELAQSENWVKPRVDNSRAFDITGGRHPVVERALAQQSGAAFIANDCTLSANDENAHIWLLTGPNMAGKSTFLRQNALIALMAQMGSYVPASQAHIGLVSQIFSRVGASDDLARGRSTFMVEMVETAAILNQADDRALVILDEIGRGTSTFDGLSLAWASAIELADKLRAFTLFATHYFELTVLPENYPCAANVHLGVKEYQDHVVFLHRLEEGPANRSYGLQVAKLAGIPEPVIHAARKKLNALEKQSIGPVAQTSGPQPDLFASTGPSVVEETLDTIDPDELTPRQALEQLYALKALIKK